VTTLADLTAAADGRNRPLGHRAGNALRRRGPPPDRVNANRGLLKSHGAMWADALLRHRRTTHADVYPVNGRMGVTEAVTYWPGRLQICTGRR